MGVEVLNIIGSFFITKIFILPPYLIFFSRYLIALAFYFTKIPQFFNNFINLNDETDLKMVGRDIFDGIVNILTDMPARLGKDLIRSTAIAKYYFHLK